MQWLTGIHSLFSYRINVIQNYIGNFRNQWELLNNTWAISRLHDQIIQSLTERIQFSWMNRAPPSPQFLFLKWLSNRLGGMRLNFA